MEFIILCVIFQQAKQLEDEEELVPYQPGLKRGKVYTKPKEDPNILPPAQLDAELEECLNNASEAELTDIAGSFHFMKRDDEIHDFYRTAESIKSMDRFSNSKQSCIQQVYIYAVRL